MTLKLALFQGSPSMGDPTSALVTLRQQVQAAAAAGARMLVVPELFLPGYNQPDLHIRSAQPAGGPWEEQVRSFAIETGCGITFGWAERDGDKVYNTVSTFDGEGALLGRYRKIQLFGEMEPRSFTPGDSYCVFDFEGVKTALLICYDVEFPQHIKVMAEQGVRLLLAPCANPAGFEHVSDHMLPAQAAAMGLSILYCNYCGVEGDIAYAGGSLLVGPDAQFSAKAGRSETLMIVEFNDNIPDFLRTTQLSDYRKV
ncbi:MAG: carbon-nitrogen hydrolase family protein [Sulfitobacter sp.]